MSFLSTALPNIIELPKCSKISLWNIKIATILWDVKYFRKTKVGRKEREKKRRMGNWKNLRETYRRLRLSLFLINFQFLKRIFSWWRIFRSDCQLFFLSHKWSKFPIKSILAIYLSLYNTLNYIFKYSWWKHHSSQ